MNNTKGLISIIIPCYNASNYLMLLAEDLMRQEYDNYEAIFVNDGDDSQDEILEEISGIDSRFAIYKKENGGVSSARNLGLEKAKGEWVAFVDPDDRVKPCFLSSLYNAVRDVDTEFAIGGFDVKEGNKVGKHTIDKLLADRGTVDFKTYFDYIEDDVHLKACWAKLFRKDVIDVSKIQFDTRFSMGEDWIFVLMYYQYVNQAVIVENCGYCYNYGGTGLSSKYDPTHMQYILESIDFLSSLRTRIGRPISQVEGEKRKDYTTLCFSFLKNLYCTRNHPSLSESIVLIKKYLLSNEDLLYALWVTDVQKASDKLQKAIILTRNAGFIACCHKILYGINKFPLFSSEHWYQIRKRLSKEMSQKGWSSSEMDERSYNINLS